ncbi:gibberellin 2-beta-dioxygenase 8-like [Prosopis cineraria]|uniref:gibberellin 2-beta-dioxygenase 8-like n=1 Tax=Prosopis cineraria TaxID=364024 RepID=UPI00240EF9A0|nr:gibberellin 2-beta-dioxygenase 8-like [Prosopis cineraria]XP_054816625.1 gibberellin 2-beta-dioxygenase 8-like [Prosopis cineraria]
MDYEPPFLKIYSDLLRESQQLSPLVGETRNYDDKFCEVPLIDIGKLNAERDIIEAARKWGFFQVVNHGIPQELLDGLMREQMMEVFHRPFGTKCEEHFVNNLSASASSGYRWGNPSATSLRQLSWSEAFHVFLPDIATMDHHTRLRSNLKCFATKAASLAERFAEILGEEVKMKSSYFRENCLPNTSFLRLNRYPVCPVASRVFGLLPRSDSSFLTIVYEDQVGGLQLMKDGKWCGIKPNPQALLVNIGDLFQAASNGVYRSIKHRVLAAEKEERYSVAYFYSPSYDTVIESHERAASLYRKFSFREYKQQADRDVKELGNKLGLSRFLL